MVKKTSEVKLTVLKRFDTNEIFDPLPIKTTYSGPCSLYKDGQEFIVKNENQPKGLCPLAWNALFPYILTLMNNGNFREWYDEDGVAVGCCPDGLRPVVFKLERI
jgi:uncharacterized repeat protein (TIGR04076 family)